MKEFIEFNGNISENELKELNIFVSNSAVIQDGAKIYFNSCIMGDSIIYSGSVVHNNSTISNSIVRKNSHIYSSRIENSEIGENCNIGPFAIIKNNSEIGDNTKIGNFVEVKNCTIAHNVSVSALSCLADAEIGNNTSIGSGVIFSSNADNKIFIGDSVTIGDNSSLIAPLTIVTKVASQWVAQ